MNGARRAIPEKGLSDKEIFEALEGFRRNDFSLRSGRMFGHGFVVDDASRELTEGAYRMYLWENAMDPTLFPSLVELERQVVSMAAGHLGGDAGTVGNFTSGGTESVMLAVKSARDRALARNPALRGPTLVLPVSAHPCFHKAAAYLGVRPVVTPVDPVTCRADPSAIEQAVSDTTVLVAASAPSYAHGVIDPIPRIARMTEARGIPFHVDGCIGAFLLPYFRALGEDVPDFDFSVPGVTSISMDFHKYAYAPKGASVVLYRRPELRKHQIFAFSDWPGYALINPTVQSSRSGGPLAAAWAALCHFGDAGYRSIAERLLRGTKKVVRGVERIDGLRVLARPDATLVAIASERAGVFRICDAMKKRGWHMYPQFRAGGLPESFHLTILPNTVDRIDAWLRDLEDVCAQLEGGAADPEGGDPSGSISPAELAGLTDEALEGLMRQMGLGGGGVPGEMASINEILNELPAGLRDRILVLFYQLLAG